MKNFFKKLSFVLAIAMVLTSLTPATASAATKNYIKLNGGKKVTKLTAYVGGTVRNLDYVVGGKSSGVKGTWKSSDTSVLTVDKYGVVTPTGKNGHATVTFTPADKSGAASVYVKTRTRAANLHIYDAEVYATGEKVKLEDTTVELTVGEEKDLKVTLPMYKKSIAAGAVRSSYYSYAEVSDETVVKVTKNNNRSFDLKALKAGEATVTIVANQTKAENVRANDYYVEQTFTVKVGEELKAEQAGYNTIKVTGAKLTDKAADYVVKRGNIVVALDEKVTLNDAKTEAILTSASSKLTKGDYTLTVSDTAVDFAVEEEEVDSVEIIGTNLVLTAVGASTAKIGYRVLNQFGENMALTVKATCNLGSATETSCKRAEDGEITITLATTPVPDVTTGTLTIVENTRGKSDTAQVTVSSAAKISSVEVLGVYDISGELAKEAKLVSGDIAADKYGLLLSAKDQYGAEFDPEAIVEGATVSIQIAGTANIVKGSLTTKKIAADGADYAVIKFDASTLNVGKSTVMIIGTQVGLLAQYDVEVTQAVVIASLELTQAGELYNGTKGEVSFVALDTEGNEVKDFDKLSALPAGTFSVTGFVFEKQDDGTVKLFYTPNLLNIPANATHTGSLPSVVITTVGTSVKTAYLTVNEAKRATQIIGVNGVTTALNGGNLLVKAEDFVINDQYGNKLSADEIAGLDPVVTFSAISGSDSFAALPGATVTLAEKSTVVFNMGATVTTGALKVTVGLNGLADSSKVVTFNNVKIDDVTDFEIKGFDNFVPVSRTSNTNVSDVSTSVAIKVVGKYKGTDVEIPSSFYTRIFGTIYGETRIAAVNKGDEANTAATKTEDVEIVINNTAGTSIKKTATFSSEDPKLTKASVVSAGMKFDKAQEATVTVTEIVSKLDLKDQYGDVIAPANPRVKFGTLPSGITVANNNTSTAVITVGTSLADRTVVKVPATIVYPEITLDVTVEITVQ